MVSSELVGSTDSMCIGINTGSAQNQPGELIDISSLIPPMFKLKEIL